jgi:signal transduction histidine kinase
VNSLPLPLRLVGFAAVCWAVTTEVRPGLAGVHLAAWLLLVSIAPAWVGRSFRLGAHPWLQVALLLWISVNGAALAVFAPFALAFVLIAAIGASSDFELLPAAALSAAGPAAIAVVSAAASRPLSLVLAGLAAALGGVIFGASQRQSLNRAAQAGLVALERERADLERARSEVLAERNRLAREIHDVLAHTLGAISVQLEAVASLSEAHPGDQGAIRDGLVQARALTREGLVEARRAVRALRDDSAPFVEQLELLSRRSSAELSLSGELRVLPADAGLALYRVAQESLANATKHAPGAERSVALEFGSATVTLTVINGASAARPGELARSGGGYGLQGISERIRLLGGEIEYGPAAPGWRVSAKLPL